MIELIAQLNFLLALGGCALVLIAAVLTYDLKTTRSLAQSVARFGLLAAFLVTLGGTAMTLLYSEVFGFVPCGLCWFQRIFMYPQLLLTGTAILIKDKTVAIYGIVLSVPGVIVSLYQHYLQMGGAEFVTCPVAGVGADCSERILFEFGFVTFPLLATFMFIFLIAVYYYLYVLAREQTTTTV